MVSIIDLKSFLYLNHTCLFDGIQILFVKYRPCEFYNDTGYLSNVTNMSHHKTCTPKSLITTIVSRVPAAYEKLDFAGTLRLISIASSIETASHCEKEIQ